MSSRSVNLEKSIRRKRLVYNLNASLIFEMFFTYLTGLMLTGVITIPAIVKPSNISSVSIWYILFCIVFDGWIISNLILMNAMVKIEGKDSKENRLEIDIILNAEYSKLLFNASCKSVFQYSKDSSFFGSRYGKRITVIFMENLVYVNIVSLGRDDQSPSLFHGLRNYLKCKEIASKFKELQKEPE
jgi:hypothetical protein